jgi:hypothetical protein
MVAGFTQNAGTFAPDDGLLVHDGTNSRSITLITGQNLKRGSLLGRITASGKYTLSLAAAADGSEVPKVILAEDTDASAADKVTVAYFAGHFDENRVIFGTGQTAANTREALRDFGILLESSITG